MNIWVVFSKDRGNKFWSSEQQDWVEFERATRFSEEQKNSGYIPEINIPLGGDDEWMTLDEAFLNHSFQAVKMQHEIAISIDCMLQEDATGETVVFVREGVQLVSKKVAADSIDLDQIQQYEMILFDGGNIHGDQWNAGLKKSGCDNVIDFDVSLIFNENIRPLRKDDFSIL